MTRAALLAFGLLVACNGGGTNPPPGPPPPPPTGTLYKLEGSLKPMPLAERKTRPPNADEFWVGKGQSKVLTVTAKRLSPLAKKVRIEMSVSGAFTEVSPRTITLEGNASADFTVSVNPGWSGEPFPYFFFYGYILDENNRTMDDQIRLDYSWNPDLGPTNP
jgi:hypothetical protein